MTCTIIGLVVACSGAPVQTTPAQSLALMKAHAAETVDVQVAERPAGTTRRDTAAEALALMKQHEPKIVVVPNPYRPIVATRPEISSGESRRRRFGESPWWWSELYDPWWYEPWVAKPWQLEPRPEPCCGR
jgi:hypothetical protein